MEEGGRGLGGAKGKCHPRNALFFQVAVSLSGKLTTMGIHSTD